MLRIDSARFPASYRFLRRFVRADHVCASGAGGTCPACNSGPVLSLLPVGTDGLASNVSGVRRVRRFLRDRAETARRLRAVASDAVGSGLPDVAKAASKAAPLAAVAYTAQALAPLTRKADTLTGEVRRVAEARARRAETAKAKAAKAQAERVADQAALFALRASMDATYRVWIRFARGAHAIKVATEAPKGFREARASRKVRGDRPGMRFREAETLAANIERKMGASRAQQRRA
jgi:hypothetical protein